MKKPITCAALFLSMLFTKPLFAQTEKGNILSGGSLYWSTGKTNGSYESKYSSMSFNPDLAYMVIDRLAIGATVPLSFSSCDTEYSSTTRSLSFGPMVRYYIPAGQWAFFPEVSYAFGKSISKGQSG